MRLVTSFEEVRTSINEIRNLRKGCITNFYLDEKKVNLWVNQQLLWIKKTNESVVFIKRNDGFLNIFFYSTAANTLLAALSQLDKNNTYILEQLIDKKSNTALIDDLETIGFRKYKKLVRMSRLNNESCSSEVKTTENASPIDIPIIHHLLHEYFDKYAEQLPTMEELEELVKNNHIIILKKNKNLVGFIIYFLAPSTLHLRYWFVCPEFRNQGLGDILFREFCHRGEKARRHILWVMENNHNAIMRYKHYGYKTEDLKDYILIKTTL